MKKKLICLLLAVTFLFVLTVPAFADTANVIDEAALLNDSQKEALQRKIDSISSRWNVNLAILTVEGITNDYEAETCADDAYDEMFGINTDGALLLYSPDRSDPGYGYYAVSTSGMVISAMDDGDLENLEYTMSDYLHGYSGTDYAGAFGAFLDKTEAEIRLEVEGEPYHFVRYLIIGLILGLIVAAIATGSMKSKLKSVRNQYAAANYVRENSMNLTDSRDVFLYASVNRVRRQTTSNTSTRSGSSTHVSSSGGTHGGRSGRI